MGKVSAAIFAKILNPVPVQSVNAETGEVVLDASDIPANVIGGPPATVSYWSKLEDISGTQTPEVGPSTTVVGSPTFPTGEFGNGMLCSNGTNRYGASFPTANAAKFNPVKGSLELWYAPQGYSLVNAQPSDSKSHILFYWSGAAGTMQFSFGNGGVFFDYNLNGNVNIYTPPASVDLADGIFGHFAITWDRDVPGNSTTIKVYFNNVEVASATGGTPATTPDMTGGTAYLGFRTGAGDLVNTDKIIDNPKWWDYVTTTFSNIERFLTVSDVQAQLEDKVAGPASNTADAVVRFDGLTGKLAKDSAAFTADDSGNVSALSFSGDGAGLTNVGSAAASALTLAAKVNEAGGITKGQGVYISGATGQTPQVSLTDNTNSAKFEWVGIAAESKTDGQNILVRMRGELTNFDTDQSGAWSDGDKLWLSTAGDLTNTRPTSGSVQHVGYVSYAHASNGKMVVTLHNEAYIAAASGDDIDLRMGDSAGAQKIVFEDYDDAEVGSVDSNGNATFETFQIPARKVMPKTFDSAGINAAIDALGATGGEVYLPAGDYDVTAEITIDAERTKLLGAGRSTRLLATNRATFDAATGTLSVGDTITGSGSSYTAEVVKITYTDASNGILWYNKLSNSGNYVNDEVLSSGGNDITVDGAPTEQSFHAVNLGSNDRCTVQSLSILGGSGGGNSYDLVNGDGCVRTSIRNCFFEESDRGDVYLSNAENSEIVDNDTIGTTGQGGSIIVEDSEGCSIEGNNLTGEIGDTSHSGITLSSSSKCIVADNKIEGFNRGVSANTSQSNIVGNHIRESTQYGVYTSGSGNHNITGNNFEGQVGGGVDSAGTESCIVGNSFRGVTGNAIIVRTETTVVGNYIEGTGGSAADIHVNGNYATVSGNVCNGNGTTNHGILIDADSDYCVITGNTTRAHDTAGIEEEAGATDNIITGNNVTAESTPYIIAGTDTQELTLIDGRTAPAATVGIAKMYIDSADGDLKIIFGDGTVKTISVDT